MNQLQISNFGITEKKGVPVVSSRKLSEVFNKRHDNVLRDVEDIKSNLLKIEEIDWEKNFISCMYKDGKGRKQPEVLMTRDGFTLVTFGFTGKKALKFKIAYINQFNEMERFIQSLTAAKLDHPEFTKAIMSAHEEPRHYHFSNESDMINRIVLGMSAKKFKEANDLGNVASIRPHLTPEQIDAIEKLQRFDIGLILVEPEFDKRKQVLTEYYSKLTAPKLRGISA